MISNRLTTLASALAVLSIYSSASAQIPAFSGADGAARTVSGGRGGIVYHVTKLNSAIDDPARNDLGTIRYGLNSANFPANTPRTIVFDVGGVFHLGRLDQPNAANQPWLTNGNGWDAQSRLTIGGTNVTLAGQTAPGKGVIFMGGGLKPQGNNNIIRNVTVAAGYGMSGWWSPGNAMRGVPGTPEAGTDASQWYPDNVVYDSMDIAAANGLMIDHVSTLFGTDETISMNETAFNVTVQYSNISQALNYPQFDTVPGVGLTGHALGSLLSAGGASAQAAVTFHHNLYAHQKGRVPQLQGGLTGAYYDFRNNVFYNWLSTAGTKSGATSLNLVNNFYLAGNGGDNPIGGTTPGWTTTGGGTSVLATSATVFRSGNLLDTNKDGDANDGAVVNNTGGAASALWMGGVPTYLGATDSATSAFNNVLNYMGANWWTRDNVIDSPDERIINEARTGTGKIIAWADDPFNADPNEGTEWRALRATPQANRAANWDTEASVGYGIGDGMPSDWELHHGLDPNVRDDAGDFDNDGYTNLEEYLNDVAAWPAPQPLVFNGTTNNRYAQITNWSLEWQPSRYDVAKINTGTIVVDAVGQHAGTLLVGFDAGSSGHLSATAGWIETNVVRVGNTSGSIGMITLGNNGAGGHGEVRVGNLIRVANTGALNFAGGTLALGNAGILDYTGAASPLAALTAEIVNGRNTGIGITMISEVAAANRAIGIAEAGELGLTTFAGEAVDSTTVLMLVTTLGDANLDRAVNFDDLLRLAQHYDQSGTWASGDFNYDGGVTFDDLLLLAQNYEVAPGVLASRDQFTADLAMAFALAPEPTSLALLAMAMPMVRRRRI